MSDDDSAPIPSAALDVLREPWRTPEEISSFDQVLEDNPERRTDPSYYHHRLGDTDLGSLRSEHAMALVRAGVFGRLARDNESSVAINEHAEHAFVDFCEETYQAWERFKQRMASLPRS